MTTVTLRQARADRRKVIDLLFAVPIHRSGLRQAPISCGRVLSEQTTLAVPRRRVRSTVNTEGELTSVVCTHCKLETMSWSSILPSSLEYIEVWITRLFLILGGLVLGPWLLLVVYDFFVYIFRIVTYEIPFIGGRARNRPRPRAPSLSERPSGQPREFRMSVPVISIPPEAGQQDEQGGAESMQRLQEGQNRRRRPQNPPTDE
ncbi:hypothetical protein V495_02982 [Pseudogymnoascus sp. VKM F-4514 (FW-929)]|nr:hypothetical protein V495_02982 [Pseudogymnoascus sp. VKM F-4514 (FW-929)]